MPTTVARRSLPLALASAFLLAGAAAAHAQLTGADSAALAAVTQALLDAVTSGDSAVWAAHLSPDWFMTDEEGRHVTRDELLRGLRPLPAGQQGKLRLADRHLVGTPHVAVMSYAADEEHDFYGQRLVTRFHTTDTWVRRNGGWKLLASQVTALPTAVAGRRLARPLLRQYAGTYALTGDITVTIEADTAGLRLVRSSGPPERLYALDERIFIRHGVRGFWVFERDSTGAVSRLVNWRDNNGVVWRRGPG